MLFGFVFFFLKLLLKWARPSIPSHLLRALPASFLIIQYVGTFFRPKSEALPCDQGQKDVQAETLRFCLWRLSHFFCSPNTIAAFIGLLCHLASSLPKQNSSIVFLILLDSSGCLSLRREKQEGAWHVTERRVCYTSPRGQAHSRGNVKLHQEGNQTAAVWTCPS